MNNKKWLVRVVSLTATLALSLSFGLAACTPSGNGDHTHSYTQWAHDDTQHWKVCPDDNTADESTKANHSFVEGACECGATEGTVTPDVELDTREFYVVGGGMGDLKDATWNTCVAQYKFTKAEKADANGNTVYTITLKLYSGDTFKIIQPTTITSGSEGEVWDDSTVLDFSALADPTGVFTENTGGNIAVAVGADGIYEFTIRTTKGGELRANKVEFKLVEQIPSLDVANQYEMYLVGSIASKPTTQWPSASNMDKIPTMCYKLELQEDGKTFSIEVVLATTDRFKVWNYKVQNTSAGYYPDGMNNDLKVSKAGTYVVSWVIGENTVSVKEHEHRYTEWGKSETEHWKYCATDNVIDESTRASHNYGADNTCECGAIKVDACAHENPAIFNYTADTVPMPAEEGGELDLYCPDCGVKLDEGLKYKKGFENIAFQASDLSELDGAGTYYAKTYSFVSSNGNTRYDPSAYISFQAAKAGTYTLRFRDVFSGDTWWLYALLIDSNAYGTSITKNRALITGGVWSTVASMKTKAAKFQIEFDDFSNSADTHLQLKSVTFTITEENIAEFGTLYITLGIYRNNGLYQDHDGYFLIDLDVQEAAAASAPAEVALLPKKED